MVVPYTVTIKTAGFTPNQMRRVVPAMLRTMWSNMGRYWHKQFRPVHFTKAGARKYGYSPRGGEAGNRKPGTPFKKTYTGKKLARMGHTRPLVWTGMSELRSALRDVRATKKGYKVALHTPGLNRRPKGGRINMAREMRTMTTDEVHMQARIGAKSFEASTRKTNKTTTRRL